MTPKERTETAAFVTTDLLQHVGLGRAVTSRMDPRLRVRVIRTIVYEGCAGWVEVALERSHFPTGVGPTPLRIKSGGSMRCIGEDAEILP